MGSHSGEAGAWVSGPEDLAPPEYYWGYNKMTTIQGLFAAGDGVGAAPHKFSSGSFTEGRLAAKAAVNYVLDHSSAPTLDNGSIRQLQEALWAPLQTFDRYKGASTAEEVNPHYITPKQGLVRLQKIMDEYAAGTSAWYTTNGPMLQRGIELIQMLRADLQHLAARDLHELLRCWELWHRTWVGEIHMRHMLYRKETRWPGYYYRADYPNLDDTNWRVFVNSRYHASDDTWELFTKPYINLVK
jgi:adenylylsulfate reductase subunit A